MGKILIDEKDYWLLIDCLFKLILINDRLENMKGKWLS